MFFTSSRVSPHAHACLGRDTSSSQRALYMRITRIQQHLGTRIYTSDYTKQQPINASENNVLWLNFTHGVLFAGV